MTMAAVICLECRRLGFTCAGCTHRATVRNRWQDTYNVGDFVEILVNDEWRRAVVVRKMTGHGYPVVRDAVTTVNRVMVRKSEIRK